MEAVDTIEYKGFTIEIHQEEWALDPRKEFDQVGHIVHWHRCYDLGEYIGNPLEWIDSLVKDQKGYDKLMKELNAPGGVVDVAMSIHGDGVEHARNYVMQSKLGFFDGVMLPLALLDHSGLHLWVGSGAHWCDPGGWDSGQVGFIYCTRQKAMDEWGKKNFTKAVREQAEACLRSEVAEYDAYLSGAVYGFNIEETGDSCGGFYGSDHAKSGLLEAAKDSIDCHSGHACKKRYARLKELIRNHVPLTVRERELLHA